MSQELVLARTREKLEALEARLAAVEAAPGAASGNAAKKKSSGKKIKLPQKSGRQS